MKDKSVIGFSNVHGTKSIDFPQYPDSAWTFLSGAPEGENTVKEMTKAVPWLNRGLGVLVQSASEVPICLMKGDVEQGYLGDSELKSPFNYTEDLPLLIKKWFASVVLEGYAYGFRDMARMKAVSPGIKTKKIWYWSPLTVTFDAQKTLREKQLYFKRSVQNQQDEFTDKDVIYFWPPDPYVEVGPPTSSPAKAALAAAGVLYNIDKYVARYFDKGAVRAYIFSKEGGMPEEAETNKILKKMTDAVTGVGKAFKAIFMSNEVKVETIGDGLEGLQDSELTKEKREDISTALGVPQSILWSTEAGGLGGSGVTQEDTFRLFRMTVVPLVRFIVDTLNKQQLKDTGYSLVVREQDMDVFQEDETARAGAVASLVSSIEKPDEFLIAADILGYDLTDEQISDIEALAEERKKQAEEIQNNMNPKETPKEELSEETGDLPVTEKRLATWRRFTLKRGRESVSKFDTNGIPEDVVKSVISRVEQSTNEDELKAAFDSEPTPIVVRQVDPSPVIEAMRIEMQALKSAPTQPANINVTIHPSDPTPVTVTNTMPEVKAEPPTVIVNVPETQVTVNNQVETPEVNVTNLVQPATIENVVKMPSRR